MIFFSTPSTAYWVVKASNEAAMMLQLCCYITVCIPRPVKAAAAFSVFATSLLICRGLVQIETGTRLDGGEGRRWTQAKTQK